MGLVWEDEPPLPGTTASYYFAYHSRYFRHIRGSDAIILSLSAGSRLPTFSWSSF
jgi:hypothetical protein